MFNVTTEAKKALHVDVAISGAMQEAIDLWWKMYQDEAPWVDENTPSLGLPGAIAAEIARLTTVEMESKIVGDGPRVEFLQAEYEAEVLKNIRVTVEQAVAGGGIVFKPYVDGKRIAVDIVPAWRFFPTAFNSRGEVTGAVFVEQVTKGKMRYTRMEHHELTDTAYEIHNTAYVSHNTESLGRPCGLDAVDEWADLEPDLVIGHKSGAPIGGVLFSYFRMPAGNTVDPGSPLGVSGYSRAVDQIREADKQYGRILWEYEGSELAIDASMGALQVTSGVTAHSTLEADGFPPAPPTSPVTKMPARKQRLFRQLSIDQGQNGDLYKVFSPAIRDESLFHGLDELLKRIEFNCSLAYGTLSNPQTVDKTAEEIRSSKQRSYASVCNVQQSLQAALEHLIWVMDLYASLYKLAPAGKYETSFVWGDGILQDTDKEFVRRKSLVDSGLLRPELFVAWYFGIPEEEAMEYLPKAKGAPKLFEEE